MNDIPDPEYPPIIPANDFPYWEHGLKRMSTGNYALFSRTSGPDRARVAKRVAPDPVTGIWILQASG
ncbi:hypothetical protein ACRC7T_15315 [Segnochrobactraceae bacterium EtOH-i3]